MSKGRSKIEPKDGEKTRFSYGNTSAEKWTVELAKDLAEELILWLNEKSDENEDKGNIFFEEFLIIEKGLHPSTIAYLSKKFTPFLNLIEKAKKIQEIKLVKYGVADRLNATMTKFVLTNNHGYSEKQELTGKNGEPIQIVSDPFSKMRENNGINDKTEDSV